MEINATAVSFEFSSICANSHSLAALFWMLPPLRLHFQVIWFNEQSIAFLQGISYCPLTIKNPIVQSLICLPDAVYSNQTHSWKYLFYLEPDGCHPFYITATIMASPEFVADYRLYATILEAPKMDIMFLVFYCFLKYHWHTFIITSTWVILLM